MAVCTQCGASIRWASTRTGRRLPLDAEPAPWSVLHSWVLDGDVARLADPRRDHSTVPRYRTHWVTCVPAAPHSVPVDTPSARVTPTRGPARQVPDRRQH